MPAWVRLVAGIAALLAVYFAIPVRADANLVVRLVLTIVGVGVAAVVVVRQIRRQLRGTDSPLWGLVLAVPGGILVFALADYIIAVSLPGQFNDLNTRVDALYFALTTLATVGYGDVHAQGQLARVAVSVQMVFNLIVLTTAARVLFRQVSKRAKPSSSE